MDAVGFLLFDTAIGVCGLAWNRIGVIGVQLPEASADGVRAWLQRRFRGATEGEPPAAIASVRDGLVALLGGERPDLSRVPLDLSKVPELHRRVYEVARAIPPGATLTYGEVAERLGDPELARAVGTALGRNPCPLLVPCHRVVAAGGELGGFSAYGGIATKAELLAIEARQPRPGRLPFEG